MALGESFDPALAAARMGAEWAWTAIYNDLAPVVLRYAGARGAAEPEDLVGDVFLRVVDKLSQFEGNEAQFKAWVLTIAHRRLIDESRCRARRPVDPAPHEVIRDAGRTGNTEEESMTSLATQQVRWIIGKLSSDQRDVLLLRILAGLTVDEVASVVGKTPGAVKALQARGLSSIRRELAQQGVTLSASAAFT